MANLYINQPVDVHSHPPSAQGGSRMLPGDEHVHPFNNLIPACEFAVSLAEEGHLNISVHPEIGSAMDVNQARRIVKAWTSGEVPLDAEQMTLPPE